MDLQRCQRHRHRQRHQHQHVRQLAEHPKRCLKNALIVAATRKRELQHHKYPHADTMRNDKGSEVRKHRIKDNWDFLRRGRYGPMTPGRRLQLRRLGWPRPMALKEMLAAIDINSEQIEAPVDPQRTWRGLKGQRRSNDYNFTKPSEW